MSILSYKTRDGTSERPVHWAAPVEVVRNSY